MNKWAMTLIVAGVLAGGAATGAADMPPTATTQTNVPAAKFTVEPGHPGRPSLPGKVEEVIVVVKTTSTTAILVAPTIFSISTGPGSLTR